MTRASRRLSIASLYLSIHSMYLYSISFQTFSSFHHIYIKLARNDCGTRRGVGIRPTKIPFSGPTGTQKNNKIKKKNDKTATERCFFCPHYRTTQYSIKRSQAAEPSRRWRAQPLYQLIWISTVQRTWKISSNNYWTIWWEEHEVDVSVCLEVNVWDGLRPTICSLTGFIFQSIIIDSLSQTSSKLDSTV